ncbi:LytR/AlgR family response regulator transcription factor [Bowmanella denitrificans]|uniref:LytR/AlgR family response regulator transcription factor n=1 Tax=Bowmanella denitrificans TaxID=366582 RepID=UPI000C9CD691|nr:LytTR family DNA-binding domain-containing protein [Bowmanella denitrificans]
MSWFARFDRHPRRYVALALTAYLFINNSINATSDWMETNRDGSPDFALWEPFAWEYTSALAFLLLAPLLFAWFARMPVRLSAPGRQLLLHLVATLIFAILHVGLMVGLRELIYHLAGGNYDFGPWLREFFYEYRKDAWGYLFWFLIYQLYHFVYSRLKGEARPVDEREDSPTQVPEHFLVRKLDREFLVRVADIDYLESAGNYVNLYSQGRIYPLRSTLNELSERLQSKGFSRIHRSYAVNHQAIDNISYQSSGDGEIQLKSGHKLNLSRRYKDNLKQALS